METTSRTTPVTTADLILSGLLLAPPLVVICAWCPTFDKTDRRNAGASHTICPSCLTRELAAL
jgi:hypothetical protein